MMSDNFHGRLIDRHSSQNNHRYCGNHRPKSYFSDDVTGEEEFDPFEGDEVDERADMASFAPPESKWLHRQMNRTTAEQLLQGNGKVGSYLVRESDRKKGLFVLSYLGESGINHFQIKSLFGAYYIGGRQFSSLRHLIGFYTSFCDLLKKERLLHPVPPKEVNLFWTESNLTRLPFRERKRVVAVLPYSQLPETDELSFSRGDIFTVHNDLGDGWLWCTLERTQESGLVFKELVEELEDNSDPNDIYPWFHGAISKDEAVDKLRKMGSGSFLIKNSDNSPGHYSLFFYMSNTIHRFRIEKRGSRYIMGNRMFETLEDIVMMYRNEQIIAGYRLGTPVLKSPLEASVAARRSQEIGNKSEDVYVTLRESREMSKKNKSVRMRGFLCKKSAKSKKWKNYFFVLDSKEQHLYYYENDRRTRPKGLVDLNYSFLYLVHDSLFERPNCFQLVERPLPCMSTVYYLCAPSYEILQEWIQAIRPFCVQQLMKGQSLSSNATEVRTLFVTLLEAHRLPIKLVPHPFCIISLNQVKVCRTQVKCPPDPIWEEDFVLEDMPCDVNSFSITLYTKGKRSKDTEVAEMVIELNKLNNGIEIEDWFPLTGICPPMNNEWGSLRVRIRYVHELIMPSHEYDALKELLMAEDLEVISVLEEFCHRDRAPLANALLRVFKHESKEAILLKSMIEREIKRENETSTLFRMNSLTTTLMDQYMRTTCHTFLMKALKDSLQRVLETRQSCELNPSRLDSLQEACANAEHLLSLLDDVVEKIFRSVEHCPATLRYICGCLQRAVSAKWPNDHYVKTRVVGSFIFLRLICPAILNPRVFNIINETPSEIAARSLILIAKSLQNLANLVEFGVKEPWMEVVNPFILKNKARMIKFLNDLSNVYECPDPEDIPRGDASRELATVHSLCELYKDEIFNLSHNRTTLRKLVAVSDMLTKHKLHYSEACQTTLS
ncbi:ras GTPase-activating protein 1 isoform X2 [Tetranychus urticae]|uniref:ras GTPase-activating protein 1 isoform X2 n=1 Tax=Tetranychus urticae TaxID=32264 RepID=UPI00077B96A6|nr:ras GTPase-activating protein 1 isoform X2 [Tetranychus urticae]